VADTHRVGGGFGDLVVSGPSPCPKCGYMLARTAVCEVKSPNGKPNLEQTTFAVDWPGLYVVAYDLQDVEMVFENE